MVEETLKTVREAEEKADKIISDADIACKEIVSEARQKAADRQREQVETAKQAAGKALEKAGEKQAAAMEKAKNEVAGETALIRSQALSRQNEAIRAVIEGLY